ADAVTLSAPNISISGDFALGLAALGTVIVFTLRFPHRSSRSGDLPHQEQIAAINSAAGNSL
ncbi:MAG: hypothetical protein KGO02_00720, partial [Alphaproteobacteria bacterium]|nr:hypothetical protein [Alphaproteobacteria bacterium]